MRKGLRSPTSLDEVRTRVRKAKFQIGVVLHTDVNRDFDYTVAYRVPTRPPYPMEIFADQQRELDGKREALSRRVQRHFQRTGNVSLVCDLLRKSPVFLREEWVNDLFLEHRKTILRNPDLKARSLALRELKALAAALTEERPAAGGSGVRRRALAKTDSSARSGHLAGLQKQYEEFLEIGSCLKAVRGLLPPARPGGESTAQVQERLSADLQLADDWLTSLWHPRRTAGNWALDRVAEFNGMTPAGVRRRLEDAKAADRRLAKGVPEVVRETRLRRLGEKLDKSVRDLRRKRGVSEGEDRPASKRTAARSSRQKGGRHAARS
jgi:hypothetical protein